MAEDRENIHRLAQQLREEEARRDEYEQRHRQGNIEAQERLSASRIDYARRKEEKAQVVLELCGRFAVWGTQHDIPYNSPSMFAQGWLLGERNGEPKVINPGVHLFSDSDSTTYSNSNTTYSKLALLVNRNASVRELVLWNPRTASLKNHFPLFLFDDAKFTVARFPQPEDYTIGSIEETIAEFSANHNVEW